MDEVVVRAYLETGDVGAFPIHGDCLPVKCPRAGKEQKSQSECSKMHRVSPYCTTRVAVAECWIVPSVPVTVTV